MPEIEGVRWIKSFWRAHEKLKFSTGAAVDYDMASFRDHVFSRFDPSGFEIDWERAAKCDVRKWTERTRRGYKIEYTSYDCRVFWPFAIIDRLRCDFGGELPVCHFYSRTPHGLEVKSFTPDEVRFGDHKNSEISDNAISVMWGYGYEVPCVDFDGVVECSKEAAPEPPGLIAPRKKALPVPKEKVKREMPSWLEEIYGKYFKT